jgi:hypothetical protein
MKIRMGCYFELVVSGCLIVETGPFMIWLKKRRTPTLIGVP